MKGLDGVLKALVNFFVFKTPLLPYGSEFLPFLALASSSSDQDAALALKENDRSDEGYSFFESKHEGNYSARPRVRTVDYKTKGDKDKMPQETTNVCTLNLYLG